MGTNSVQVWLERVNSIAILAAPQIPVRMKVLVGTGIVIAPRQHARAVSPNRLGDRDSGKFPFVERCLTCMA